jgi:hypothetical protein
MFYNPNDFEKSGNEGMVVSVGRGVWYPKTTTTECLMIDMAYLTKNFDLEKEYSTTITWTSNRGKESFILLDIEPPGFIRLRYTLTKKSGEKHDMNYRVYLTTTECNYGGKRYWFLCPSCTERCRILYLHPTGYRFTCRICNNLTYPSQQEGYPRWRAMRDAVYRYPEWERQYFRTRSEKKRRRLLKKMSRVEAGMRAIIAWGKRGR